MSNTKLAEGIHWIGYVDWDVRDFHGYVTDQGSTYNSYIIKDEKIAVIDSVKAPYAEQLIENILEHTSLDAVDYVICNHAEPDHSGSIPTLMDLCPNAELVCSAKCQKALSMHYDVETWNFKIVDEATQLSLGKNTLQFVNTPMAHWPESMMTYAIEEKILFSMDAFGQHYATSARFDTEANLGVVLNEAKKYYANIIMLYNKPVTAAFAKVAKIDIKTIAPSHGIIWTKHIPEILAKYSQEWVCCKPKAKVFIFFSTMWKSTSMMADAIYKGANQDGIEVKKLDLSHTHITEIATEIIDSAVIAVGSPTLNKGIMPKTAEALTYLKGLAAKGKSGIAFGSYGWGKKSGGQDEVVEYLNKMDCKLLLDAPIQSQFVPTNEVLAECEEAGKMLAAEAKKIAAEF